jgi:phenylpropionate dioxygenase-like ring-hydroxylating dioxygenase large terminal subunit
MPYLLNAWYAAAASSEVTTDPRRRTLLDMPVVLYRTEGGGAHILMDRCPHRFVPLSRGRVVGELLECGYHGLRFDSSGTCAFNPHGDGAIPPNAKVRGFPVMERYGYVWFWPGDVEAADPLALPAFPFLEDPEHFAVDQGYIHANANYQLIVDNLLDLSHAPYLHGGFVIDGVSTEERLKATEVELIRVGNSITNRRYRRNFPPNRPTRELFGVTSERVDNRTTMHWHAPALLHFDLGACEVGQPEEEGLCIPAGHFITPETDRSSHYFFAQARNRFIDDPKVGETFFNVTHAAFHNEDEPMVAAQQAQLGSETDILKLRPVYLQTDQASVAARRVLLRLIEAEQTSVQQRAAVTSA